MVKLQRAISRLMDIAHAGARARFWGGLRLDQRVRLKTVIGPSPITPGMRRRSALFIHIPKTAGTSVTQALFSEWPHASAPYFLFERRDKAAFDSYFRFAFVRNPWDRLVSAYYYLRRSDLSPPDLAWVRAHMGEIGTFDHFVRHWLNEDRMWAHEVFAPQHFFVVDSAGQVRVDFIGRFENLHSDFRTICERLGVAVDLPRLNESVHPHFSACYDNETREIVAKLYARDIQLFAYEFGETRASTIARSV